MFGIVKETGVDDEGLKDFHDTYFPYPLYRDVDLKFYEAFGNKSIFAGLGLRDLNPFKVWKGMKKMSKRFKQKSIEGNMVGDGVVTGGIIIFDKNGDQKYMYNEETGTPLEIDDILAALVALKESETVYTQAAAEL